MSKAAVFLDRDGVINEEVNYLRRPEDFHLLPRAAAAIRLLRKHGWPVIVITNQSGVARGYYTQADVVAVHEQMQRDLARAKTKVDAVYFCPHHPDEGCACRKPQTGLFERAAADLDLDLTASYYIGDKLSDLLPGRTLGGRTILVLTGYGRCEQELARQQGFVPDLEEGTRRSPRGAKTQRGSTYHIAADLYRAAQWIIRDDSLSP